jgi:L-ascorbate metabolism protein UlaG (beta-lactamase superfamily)
MIININGFVIVTDPAFDKGGTVYEGPRTLYKTGSPKLQPQDIGPVDLVLLSHDQHKDNLDMMRDQVFYRWRYLCFPIH